MATDDTTCVDDRHNGGSIDQTHGDDMMGFAEGGLT
jgi:hypothetical protein